MDVNRRILMAVAEVDVWLLAARRGGRRALFEAFGLGKTIQQLEWARLVCEHTGGRVLIVLPLGVKQEFQLDAVRLLGWESAPPYVRTNYEAIASSAEILLTNYERVRTVTYRAGRSLEVMCHPITRIGAEAKREAKRRRTSPAAAKSAIGRGTGWGRGRETD